MEKLEPRGKGQFQTKIFHPSQANHLRFPPSFSKKLLKQELFASLSGAKHFSSIKANVLTHTDTRAASSASFKTLLKFTTARDIALVNKTTFFQAFLEASVLMVHFAWNARSQFQIKINCYSSYTAKALDVYLSVRAPRAVARQHRGCEEAPPRATPRAFAKQSILCEVEPLFRAGCR